MQVKNLKIVDYTGKVLNEDDINDRVAKLRELVLGDNKLKNFRTDDSYLLRFLHCTDFDVLAAYKRMEDYYNYVLEHPQWCASIPPLDKKKQIESGGKVMLRETDKQGRPIYVVKMGKVDVANSSPQEQAQLDEMWIESVLEDPKAQANGVSILMDVSGYSYKMFRWITPSNMKQSTRKVEVYPCKEFVYHVVNTSFLVNASVKLVWPFLNDKIKERIKFHFNDWSSLHECISPEVLPPEYGGTAPEIDYNKLNERLFDQSSDIYERLKYQKVVKN